MPLDAAEFETLFRTYYPPLCAFAYGYVGSREDAEEIVQQVFQLIWQKHLTITFTSSIKAYLFASVRNTALNKSARARTEQRWYVENSELPPAGTGGTEFRSPEAALQSADLSARVRAALAMLPPSARRIATLRWLDQLSHAEIAEALGISIKGVENQLARAKDSLRHQLWDLVE
jgi:RNA polymerase sigma-70 factor, ECF subfamily